MTKRLADHEPPITLDRFDHPHKLVRKMDAIQFKCKGCKEFGCGERYSCKQGCNYHLHNVCAVAPDSISHPFFTDYSFFKEYTFELRQSMLNTRCCDACGRDVKGCMYHCSKKGYDLHPTCAKLPFVIELEGISLKLHKKLKAKCGLCGFNKKGDSKVTGWSYTSSCKEYNFHVGCVKDMVIDKRKEPISGKEMSRSSFGEFMALAPNVQLLSQSNGGSKTSEIMALAPNLQLVSQSTGGSKKNRVFWKIAKAVIKFLLSAIIGDPIGAIFALVEPLIFQ